MRARVSRAARARISLAQSRDSRSPPSRATCRDPRRSSVTVLPAPPLAADRDAPRRNTIETPSSDPSSRTRPTPRRSARAPTRLSHLHGPVGLPAASPPGARSGGIAATPPRPEFAPSTPANRTALRGASGTLLMGPWNGAFARADDSADPKPRRAAATRPSLAWTTTRENTSPTSSSPARTRPPSTTRASLSKRCSRTRSPAASSSRRSSTTARDRAGRQPARKSARINTIGASSSGTRRASSSAIGPPGRRTNSAPAATSRRVGARCGCRLGEGRPPRRNARISRGWRTRGGKSEAEADEGVRRAVGARSSGWRRPRGTTDRGIPRARGSCGRAPGAEARCE